MPWITLFKPGDWLVAALALAFCAISFPIAWQAGVAEKAVIKRGGEVFAELDLSRNRSLEVPGPLGITLVAVEKRRVRVVSDPGRASIVCVRAGWRAPAKSPSAHRIR